MSALEVRIIGERSCVETYKIEVLDSGRGLPPDFDLDRFGPSLRMHVVSPPASQLNTRIEPGSCDPGARFTVKLPMAAAWILRSSSGTFAGHERLDASGNGDSVVGR
ncbi:hypothetical protein [Microvirga calopogonii]|uniref:hypothetical protein n=1 Tax=Microvirga calopogonii TaxID=2078013 RepID=UPI000E0D61C4|nr:hypothetical protein [Microvirga calopogonii]